MKSYRHTFLLFVVFLTVANFGFAIAQTRQPLKRKYNLIVRKLEFAKEVQLSFRDRSTIELLSTAESKLNQARNQMQARRFLPANRMMNEAETAINQALVMLLQEPMHKRTRKLNQQIDEATQVVRNSDNRDAIDLLEKGIENKTIAVQAYRDAKFQDAIRYFKKAERQVQMALDSVKNKDKSVEENARDEADQFNKLLARAKPTLANSSNPTIQRNYRSALKLSQEAELAQTGGNYRLAIEFYHKATQLLLRTIDLAEGKADRAASRAYEEIAAMDELIEKIRQRIIPIEDDDQIQFYMTHLDQIQEDAHIALEEKNYKLVLLNTGYARDLIEQVHKKLRSDKDFVQELLDQEFNQIEVDLNELNERAKKDGSSIEAEILLTYAALAKNRAGELMNNQRYRFARESLLLARRFAFAADRLMNKQSKHKISAETVFKKIQDVEKRLKKRISEANLVSNPELQIYFDHAKKMFDFANQNFSKGYYYVANECIEACETVVERSSKISR
jgi:hypothetical protein